MHPASPCAPSRLLLCSQNLTSDFLVRVFPPYLLRYASDVQVVSAARVPVVKFTYHGTPVDIVFANVALPLPPSNEHILRDEFLNLVSVNCRNSVNGVRTILEIDNHVKVPMHTYRTVLRAIKKWARERYVYGNIFSYPNGVCLAIMVARLCLVDFKLSSSKLFRLFFTFYRQWLSRKDNIYPIFITPNINARNINLAGMIPCWDQSKRGEDLLPIINPAYPYVNAAHTVGRCGLHFFTEEINRVSCILDENKVDTPYRTIWERYSPLQDFNCFLAVHVACTAPSEALLAAAFRSKKGYVESKLRYFIYALETTMTVRPISDRLTLPQKSAVLPSKECVFLFGLKDFAKEDATFFPDESYFASFFNYLLQAVNHDMPSDCVASFDVPLFYTVHAPTDTFLTGMFY